MQKTIIRIIVLVAVLTAAVRVLVPTVYWDGLYASQVNLIVQARSGAPVSGAKVTYRDRMYDLMLNKRHVDSNTPLAELQKQHNKYDASGLTDMNGSFVFHALLRGGGKRFMLWENARFHLVGIITVEADGHKTLERSLEKLAGKKRFSTRRDQKEPIVIHCEIEELKMQHPDAEVQSEARSKKDSSINLERSNPANQKEWNEKTCHCVDPFYIRWICECRDESSDHYEGA